MPVACDRTTGRTFKSQAPEQEEKEDKFVSVQNKRNTIEIHQGGCLKNLSNI